MGAEPPMHLKEGDPAPDFTAKTGGGERVQLSGFRGKPVVLYFYPKDDTPGCTTEACQIRDRYPQFEQGKVEVLGVSPDSEQSHQKFAKKYDLPFKLLVDPDHQIAEAYGVWGQKSFLGKKYMGVQRATFLIAADGTLLKIWPKVKPDGHADEVLAALS